MGSEPSDVTLLLARVSDGEKDAVGLLMQLVYDELRRMAAHRMRAERSDHTLQPTALVHEAYLRLVQQPRTNCKDRAHFFRLAAQLMRNILVDHARNTLSAKRGGRQEHVSLEEVAVFSEGSSAGWLVLDEALNRLQRRDLPLYQIFELKYFAGMTTEEAAEALDISTTAVERGWRFAKDWLNACVKEHDGHTDRQVEQD
jgi:RNA polymerase sigma factor (TIGR02999 family)